MKRAFVFPGQGSQIIGMGRDFYNSFPAARSVFHAVNDILSLDLSKIMFEGPMQDLTLTKNTQPALMAVSVAIMHVIITQTEKKINDLCHFVAGHSLGEYSALCAASSISIVDTAKLLRIRGQSMQNALAEGVGAMAACIGITRADLEKLIQDEITVGVCEIANDNVVGQLVISGHADNINTLISLAESNNFRAIKLNVSSAFHSQLMQPAEEAMSQALAEIVINVPKVPIITNVSARPCTNPGEIKKHLLQQVCHTVRWRETMDEMARQGVTELVEVGSGKVLAGLARKSGHDFDIKNISNIKELEQFCMQIH